MSDTVKAAVIIGVCLMLGLWGNGLLSKSDVGRYAWHKANSLYFCFDTETGQMHARGSLLDSLP